MKKIIIVGALYPVVEKEKTILQRSDLKIFTTTSVEDALKMHRAEKADLIITDLDMPGMGGDILCSTIRADNDLKKVSIIVIGSNKKSDIERSSASGANSFLTRPVSPDEIVRKVSLFLNIPERKSYRVLIKVEVKGKIMNMPFFCTSQDLSSSGMLLETDKPLASGDMISCSFFLPNEERVAAEGEVVRVIRKAVKTFQYGVKFVNLNGDLKSTIDKFIKNWHKNQ